MNNLETLTDLISKQKTPGRIQWDGDGYYAKETTARHGIYLVGVDRFLLVDKMDLHMTFRCAKILSSKLPTAVLYLGEDTTKFETQDALFWTIADKNIYQSSSQIPLISKLHKADGVVNAGAPLDYQSPEQLTALIELQNYALFVLRALYSIHTADAIVNDDDHFFFARLIHENVANIIDVRPDITTATNTGMLIAIERILYTSNSVIDAYDKINRLWQTDPVRFDQKFRELFYNFMDLPHPDVFRVTIPAI